MPKSEAGRTTSDRQLSGYLFWPGSLPAEIKVSDQQVGHFLRRGFSSVIVPRRSSSKLQQSKKGLFQPASGALDIRRTEHLNAIRKTQGVRVEPTRGGGRFSTDADIKAIHEITP